MHEWNHGGPSGEGVVDWANSLSLLYSSFEGSFIF